MGERAEERAESGESKVAEYEEELNLLANNLKSVEVALDKANEKEYEYENTVKDLDERLEEALKRAEFAERTINKLEQQLDNVEEDLFNDFGEKLLCYYSIMQNSNRTF